MVTSTSQSVAPNPFNMQPGSATASSSSGSSFEQQLTQALSESLNRLGVTPGAVNITIRNNGSASARQILITYDASGEASAPVAADSAELPEEPQVSTPEEDTPWSSWAGPRDRRDQIAAGGGKVLESGAPDIQLNDLPAGNQYGYTGFAALNPYFTTPSNPPRQGYVMGFANWFRDTQIYGGKNGPVPANRLYYTTEQGAQEALRLVRQYEPAADLIQYQSGGGPFSANNAMYYVTLPGERMMNAGLLLAGYYNHGEGVTITSDTDLSRSIQSA